jgi:hypothetical protein
MFMFKSSVFFLFVFQFFIFSYKIKMASSSSKKDVIRRELVIVGAVNNEETSTKTECQSKFPFVRPKESERKFVSPVIEKVIKHMTSNMKDKDLARLFENCWPNTLGR